MFNAKIIDMKKTLFILLIIFIIACNKDDNNPPDADNTVTTEAKIGNEGGVLNSGDFEITVPAEAFENDQNIKLITKENNDTGFDNVVSKIYTLEGLPENILKEIKVKIKYTGNLEGESFIALGETNFISSLAKENTAYKLLDAVDSSGYLICTIPKTEDNSKGEGGLVFRNDNFSIGLLAVSGYMAYKSENGHFKIKFPVRYEEYIHDLGQYLEDAYKKFKDIGFSYANRTKWPVNVTVKGLANDIFGYSACSVWGDNYGYMEFNQNKLSNTGEIKVTAGHEFFHLVQALYDPRNRYSKAKFQSPYLWLDEACAVRSESFFSDKSDYVSPNFSQNANMILKGAKNYSGSAEQVQNYGYGMSAFIKYLTDKYNDGIMVKIYDEIYDGSGTFGAIDVAIPLETDLVWNWFIKKLFSFEIYKESGKWSKSWLSSYAKQTNRKFTINSDADTVFKYIGKMPQLSAKVFSIDNKYESLSSNSVLRIEAPGTNDNKIMVFKVNNDESIFLQEGKDTLSISDFKTLTENYQLVVLVTNRKLEEPYTSEQEMKVTLKVLSYLDIDFIATGSGVDGYFYYQIDELLNNEQYYDTLYYFGEQRPVYFINDKISISENIITINEDTIFNVNYSNHTNHISIHTTRTIEFDDILNPKKIVSYNSIFVKNEESDEPDYEFTQKIESNISFKDIPMSYSLKDYMLFRLTGDVSNHINQLSYSITKQGKDAGNDYSITKKLIGYNVTGGNIRIEFQLK